MRDDYGEEIKRRKETRELLREVVKDIFHDQPELKKVFNEAIQSEFAAIRKRVAKHNKSSKKFLTRGKLVQRVAVTVEDEIKKVFREPIARLVRATIDELDADNAAEKQKREFKIGE